MIWFFRQQASQMFKTTFVIIYTQFKYIYTQDRGLDDYAHDYTDIL